MFKEEKDHPATGQLTAPHHSSVHGKDSEEWLGTCPLPTLQSGPRPLKLPFVWFHTRSDVRPALYSKWGSPGSHLSMFMKCWNGVIPRADLQTSRTLAEMHCSGWKFCVQEIQRTDLTEIRCFPIHTVESTAWKCDSAVKCTRIRHPYMNENYILMTT
jgi:hypothetical protein